MRMLKNRGCRPRPTVLTAIVAGLLVWTSAQPAAARADHQILAFYYGWYANPSITGRWAGWKGIDARRKTIANAPDFPVFGAYDSHDPAIVDRQAALASAAGITGFIASWWGQGSFEDRGIPLLLSAAAKHHLAISAYYETVKGNDLASRKKAAIADLDYLLAHYGKSPAWLREAGKPVIFLYGRVLTALPLAEWREVVAQVRHGNPGGVLLIADSFEPNYVSAFDGASAYNITGQTQHKSPPEIRAWAHAAYPRMVASAGPLGITTATVIPGYDDSKLDRPPPRPVTERHDGETYRVLWEEALAARPDWVLITSWNEWFEGSELESSLQYGARILDETPAFARKFLAPSGRR